VQQSIQRRARSLPAPSTNRTLFVVVDGTGTIVVIVPWTGTDIVVAIAAIAAIAPTGTGPKGTGFAVPICLYLG
jgi:hypothetical protein